MHAGLRPKGKSTNDALSMPNGTFQHQDADSRNPRTFDLTNPSKRFLKKRRRRRRNFKSNIGGSHKKIGRSRNKKGNKEEEDKKHDFVRQVQDMETFENFVNLDKLKIIVESVSPFIDDLE